MNALRALALLATIPACLLGPVAVLAAGAWLKEALS